MRQRDDAFHARRSSENRHMADAAPTTRRAAGRSTGRKKEAVADAPAQTGKAPAPARTGPQKAMDKLGLRRDIDLALHLPLRYEDETRLTPISNLRDGDVAQVEGVVSDCQVQVRARRQLVVRLHDGTEDLVLRFLHFYPSHQKALAVGNRQLAAITRTQAVGRA